MAVQGKNENRERFGDSERWREDWGEALRTASSSFFFILLAFAAISAFVLSAWLIKVGLDPSSTPPPWLHNAPPAVSAFGTLLLTAGLYFVNRSILRLESRRESTDIQIRELLRTYSDDDLLRIRAKIVNKGYRATGIEDITITVTGDDNGPDDPSHYIFLGRKSFVEEDAGPIPGGGVRSFEYEANGEWSNSGGEAELKVTPVLGKGDSVTFDVP